MVFKLANSVLSPSGERGRLTVLIFHRVMAAPDPFLPAEPDARTFDEMLKWVKAGFNVLPLDVAVDGLKTGCLPSRAAAITFDDGYEDNASQAAPVLRRHGLSATFFISTGYLDGGIMWNDCVTETMRRISKDSLDLGDLGLPRFEWNSLPEKIAARDQIIMGLKYLPPAERLRAAQRLGEIAGEPLPDKLMMSSDQVRGLRKAGMLVGAHTRSHPILAKLTSDEVRDEIDEGRRDLESILGEKVDLFAYPNGRPHQDYRASDTAIIRDLGFKAAVSTAWGSASGNTDPFQIPRFTPWDRTPFRFKVRQTLNLLRDGDAVRPD